MAESDQPKKEHEVLQLYPPERAGHRLPLRGLYLDGQRDVLSPPTDGGPLIYGNFVSSLDGRIAVEDGDGDAHVPRELTTRADWRLFQELQAHADCFITHGGYLRALQEGRLSNILQVGQRADARDILAWRHERQLHRQPHVVIASRSLNFTLPPFLTGGDQKVIVVTSQTAPRRRIDALGDQGVTVMMGETGDDRVSGVALRRAVAALGCSRAYLEAGPWVLEGMLRCGLLHRLYLTVSHRLVGGQTFHTLIDGPLLRSAGQLRLASLYLAEDAGDGEGQFYASFRGQSEADQTL